jgi:meiosis-specific transcription factor NDT80
MDSSLGGTACPPLFPTEVHHQLQTSEGQLIKPEIFGKIDKGFFMADNDWTCYRRNYFSLNCSYTLQPTIPNSGMYLVQQHGGAGPQIQGFAMSIAAVVDGRDGKSIELVQHTPKRDKGPQERPARVTLAPRPPATHGLYGDSSSGRGNIYDTSGFNQNPNSPQIEATFERIQFKNATANNGKRRAAQQYYHLLVELFADVGQQHADRWVKIASRMSAPMVVRGRSPGHYQGERRGSNTSTGPGGSGGAGGGGSYTPSGSASRTPGDITMSGTSSMLPGSGYSGAYDSRSHHYRSSIAPLQIPMEPTLSAEEAKSIEESPCYLYYPGAIYEGGEQRFTLPSVGHGEYTTSKIKSEYIGGQGGGGGYVLPSLSGMGDGLGRHCGRWEGLTESKGYFPALVAEAGMHIT